MKNYVPCKELERVLDDSRESTVTELDELCFIRLILKCLISGMTYAEALSSTHAQLERSINDE